MWVSSSWCVCPHSVSLSKHWSAVLILPPNRLDWTENEKKMLNRWTKPILLLLLYYSVFYFFVHSISRGCLRKSVDWGHVCRPLTYQDSPSNHYNSTPLLRESYIHQTSDCKARWPTRKYQRERDKDVDNKPLTFYWRVCVRHFSTVRPLFTLLHREMAEIRS